MKLKNNISICTADITDSTSVQKLIDDTASDLPVYFSLGLLPLTVMPEHTAKILTAVSASLTPEDNLAFGFISKPGRKRPLNAPVYTRAQMTALLSERGFNVYEDSVYKTDDGSEITFFLAVKKITAQL